METEIVMNNYWLYKIRGNQLWHVVRMHEQTIYQYMTHVQNDNANMINMQVMGVSQQTWDKEVLISEWTVDSQKKYEPCNTLLTHSPKFSILREWTQ